MTRFSTTVTMLAMDDLNLTKSQMAQVESSFFYGYCLGVAPMGFIADKIGARVLITVAIGGSGAISLLTEVLD